MRKRSSGGEESVQALSNGCLYLEKEKKIDSYNVLRLSYRTPGFSATPKCGLEFRRSEPSFTAERPHKSVRRTILCGFSDGAAPGSRRDSGPLRPLGVPRWLRCGSKPSCSSCTSCSSCLSCSSCFRLTRLCSIRSVTLALQRAVNAARITSGGSRPARAAQKSGIRLARKPLAQSPLLWYIGCVKGVPHVHHAQNQKARSGACR